MFEHELSHLETMNDVDAIRFLASIVESLKKLKGRSACPCCNQDINKETVDKELLIFESSFDERVKGIEMRRKEMEPEIERSRSQRESLERAEKKRFLSYFEEIKPLMRKTIKKWRAGDENYMPEIEDDKKLLWNKAIDILVGNSTSYQDVDEFELQFDIETKCA